MRAAARESILGIWRSFSDPALRESLEFTESVESTETAQLIKSAIEQELTSINSELQTPNDRTVQRVALCLDYVDILPPKSVDTVFVRSLDVQQDAPLTRWLDVIKQYQDKLDSEFPDSFSKRCLELAGSSGSRPQRQQLMLQKFAETLGKLSPDKRNSSVKKYFLLLKDSNANTRNAAATMLSAIRSALPDTQEFKISVGNVLGDLRRDVKTPDLLQYRPVFEALTSQIDVLGEYQWRDVADLSKRLLSQTDTSLQEFGMALVERMPSIPEMDQEELLHQLVGLENSANSLKERATRRLEYFATGKLADSAKKVIESRHQTQK